MLKKLIASEWTTHVPNGEGEARSCLISLKGQQSVDFEVRSTHDLQVNLINLDGETLPVGYGRQVQLFARLEGFAALEIVTDQPFAYRSVQKLKWLEVPDETRLTVDIDEKATTPVENLVRAELQRYAGRLAAAGMLADDASLEELLDDIDNGDHEFEAEPDPYGLGYEEPDQLDIEDEIPMKQEPAPSPAPQEPVKNEPAPAPEPAPKP